MIFISYTFILNSKSYCGLKDAYLLKKLNSEKWVISY